MAKKKAKSQTDNSQSDAADSAAKGPSIKQAFKNARITQVRRSLLHFHDKNPRSIDPHAFRKLKDFIKKTGGIIGTIEVNCRLAANGFPVEEDGKLVVIGGHQRTMAEDANRGYPSSENSDRLVDVAVIEVGPAREHEILVGLNNQQMQGSWDISLLTDVLSTPDLDPFATGFDRADLATLFDQGELAEILGETSSAQASAESPVLDAIEEMTAIARPPGYSSQNKQATPPDPESADQSSSPQGSIDSAAEIQGMKDRRTAFIDKRADERDVNFMLTVVANTSGELDQFKAEFGIPVDSTMISLSELMELLGFGDPADSESAESAESA